MSSWLSRHQDIPIEETSLYYPTSLRNTLSVKKSQSESKKHWDKIAVDDEDIKVKDLKALLHRMENLE